MLLIVFVSGTDSNVSVATDGTSILVSIGSESSTLSRMEALALREAIGVAATERRAFQRTADIHRGDGTYAVERWGVDSSGNRTVFGSFVALRLLYHRLPDTFDASTIGVEGLTGVQRHMVVRQFTEHPDFDCESSHTALDVTKIRQRFDGR